VAQPSPYALQRKEDFGYSKGEMSKSSTSEISKLPAKPAGMK
jgi:hypothetical protein